MAGSRPQFHGNAINMENSLELSTTHVCLYQQQWQHEQLQITTNKSTITTNKSTATTMLLKWKSKLWRRTFRWGQFESTGFFSFASSHAFLCNKSVQTKVINFIK